MLGKVLIANRGEIALRILRACRDLQIPAVVAYSEADRESLPVMLAEETVCIGPASASRSYLSVPNVISAALVTGCDAIHPGYGFLSEDRYFAEICGEYDLTFIGPSAAAIAHVANKAEARRFMFSAGLPILEGTEAPVISLDEAQSAARDIGYPVILKAAAGGGGRGMHVAGDERDLAQNFNLARVEARAAFDSDELYLERFLQRCRHVEVQVLADSHGNIVHLGERECSIQRRHQKVIEEAPSSTLSPLLRAKLGKAAVQGATKLGFTSAGTLEFLVDDLGDFYFVEVNTRIQVEHGITELVTDVDIVREQLRIAAGERLNVSQDDIVVSGHAIECRVNAESGRDFKPSTGTVQRLLLPGGPGVRVDTHVYQGYTIPAHYDSLMAKIMVHGPDRGEAIERMRRALMETRIDGVPNTLPILLEVLNDDSFAAGNVYTDYFEARAS